MSKTIRRRHGLGRHQRRLTRTYHDAWNDIPVLLYNGPWYPRDYDVNYYDREEVATAQKLELRYLHSEKYEPMNDPSWWVHVTNTKPGRVEVRRLIHHTMKLFDLEDAPLFPDRKRAHIYYW